MKQEEKRQLAGELKNAAEDVLSLVEGGGLVNPRCVKNKVAQCASCTQTTINDVKELTSQF